MPVVQTPPPPFVPQRRRAARARGHGHRRDRHRQEHQRNHRGKLLRSTSLCSLLWMHEFGRAGRGTGICAGAAWCTGRTMHGALKGPRLRTQPHGWLGPATKRAPLCLLLSVRLYVPLISRQWLPTDHLKPHPCAAGGRHPCQRRTQVRAAGKAVLSLILPTLWRRSGGSWRAGACRARLGRARA